jgi:hypothetical protein
MPRKRQAARFASRAACAMDRRATMARATVAQLLAGGEPLALPGVYDDQGGLDDRYRREREWM